MVHSIMFKRRVLESTSKIQNKGAVEKVTTSDITLHIIPFRFLR